MTIDKMNQALKEAGEKALGFRRKNDEWLQLGMWQTIYEGKQVN